MVVEDIVVVVIALLCRLRLKGTSLDTISFFALFRSLAAISRSKLSETSSVAELIIWLDGPTAELA